MLLKNDRKNLNNKDWKDKRNDKNSLKEDNYKDVLLLKEEDSQDREDREDREDKEEEHKNKFKFIFYYDYYLINEEHFIK